MLYQYSIWKKIRSRRNIVKKAVVTEMLSFRDDFVNFEARLLQ